MSKRSGGLLLDQFPLSYSLILHRRLLYVACTRAQGLLYLSYSTSRMFAGETKSKELSEFIYAVLKGDRVRRHPPPGENSAHLTYADSILKQCL